MKKILIAGSSGHIGFFLHDKLINQYEIFSINRQKSSKHRNIFNCDLTDKNKIENLVDKIPEFEILIFLVGLAHSKGKNKEIKMFKSINYNTLSNLVGALKKKSKMPDKIIFASTISVYGEKLNIDVYNEDSSLNPKSPYAKTKVMAEKYLRKNVPNSSWILRFAPVYMPSFMTNINRRTKLSKFFYRVGDGSNKLSLCNVENILSVVIGIINSKVPSGTYNISDSMDYTYKQILSLQNSRFAIPLPKFLLFFIYLLSKLFKKTSLNENTIKLLSDNVYPSKKIRQYINLRNYLNEST